MKKLALVLMAVLAVMAAPSLSAANPDSSEKSAVIKVTNDNYKALTAKHTLLVVDFYADWCGPCRYMTPIISELAAEYAGKVGIGKCNVDDNRELTSQFGVSSIPAIFIIKNGKVVDKQIGSCDKAALKAKIEKWRK